MSKLVGASVRRVEDRRFISGRGTFVDDIQLKGQLYVVFARSPYPHARLGPVRLASSHGVRYVLTGEEAKARIACIPCISSLDGLKAPSKYPLAVDKVIFVGDPVAAIVSDDMYSCHDVLEDVEVTYEPLPAVTDPEQAMRPDSPVIHPELGTNIAYRSETRSGNIESVFRQADMIVKARLVNQRVAATPIEPRAVLANYSHRNGMLEIYASTQIPHLLKTHIASALRYPENKVRVVAPDVGGGFGSKCNIYPEELIVAYLALKLKRPVKWVETRRENFMGTTHGRDQVQYLEAAVTRDGRILGLRARLIADIGAYHQLFTPSNVLVTSDMLPGPYRIDSIAFESISVFTNKTPVDSYRGAGRPEATYAIERIVDMVAHRLRLDPAEVRMKNFIYSGSFPFKTATGVEYDTGDYGTSLRKALEMVGYQAWRERTGDGKRIGIGIGFAVDMSGFAPSNKTGARLGGWESATVRLDPSGKIVVITGICPHGQSTETTFSQLAAEKLGVKMDDISIVYGDTANVPYGIGTFGARSAPVGGSALVRACDAVLDKARKIAATLLESSLRDIEYESGSFYVRDAPENRRSLQEVATEAYLAAGIAAENIEPGLEATVFHEPAGFTFPFGAHIAVVELDEETGAIKILRYVCVDDCGRVINPMVVEGQVHGGVVQGMGQALLEEIVYGGEGQLQTSGFAEYLILSAVESPFIEATRTETPALNPLGAKGVAELPTLAATAAVVNAVSDALKGSAEVVRMPLTPDRVWALIAGKAR